MAERFGVSAFKKINKKLIWVHCASVGETISIFPLLEAINKKAPDVQFLITTYTKTAAQIVQKKSYPFVTHRYIPYDHPIFIYLFLKKWSPQAVFWVESEFWPEALRQIGSNNIPAFLFNARLSERSFKRWTKLAPNMIKETLRSFTYKHAQTDEYAEYIDTLSDSTINRVSNLKYAASALSYDDKELHHLQNIWKNHSIITFASTHQGEEDIAIRAFHSLSKEHPELLLIIVPRHPERGTYIKETCDRQDDLNSVQRSSPASPEQIESADIYIADSLGELGLFFALSPIVVIGNSFITNPGGGHNPLEAAHHHCCIIYGPSMYNFEQIDHDMQKCEASIQVRDEEDLHSALLKLINDPKQQQKYKEQAFAFIQKGNDIPLLIWGDIKDELFIALDKERI